MSNYAKPKVLGGGKDRTGKMAFIRELCMRKQNKVTRLEAIELFLKAYPTCGGHKAGSPEARQTATNSVSWVANNLRSKGETVTFLPKVKGSKLVSKAAVEPFSAAAVSAADNNAKAEPEVAESPKYVVAPGLNSSSDPRPEFPPPSPDELLQLAVQEVDRDLLSDYAPVIGTLREDKGFSFREIAEWLNDHGVPADYNAVYRLYTKGMDSAEVQAIDQQEEDEARAEMQ